MSPPERIEELPEDLAGSFSMILPLLPKLHPKVRPAAKHAVQQLRKAWLLRERDSEMAVLRAVTAEEEAASALIRSLRRIGYRGAQYLDPEKHATKMSMWPMLLALSRWMIRTGRVPFKLTFVLFPIGEEFELQTHMQLVDEHGVVQPWPNGQHGVAVNEFPLEVSMRGNGEMATFTDEFLTLAKEAGTPSVEAYIRKRADVRKDLLYASERPDRGLGDIDKRLRAYTVSTRALLFSLVLVDPHPVQSLAQQVVDAVIDALQPILPPTKRTPRRTRTLDVLPVYARYCRACGADKLVGLAKNCPDCAEPLRGWNVVGVQFRDASRVIAARPLAPGERWQEIEPPETT